MVLCYALDSSFVGSFGGMSLACLDRHREYSKLLINHHLGSHKNTMIATSSLKIVTMKLLAPSNCNL